MSKEIETVLDNDEALQQVIMTPEWAHDARGTLISRALCICTDLGASVIEASEYLELGSAKVIGFARKNILFRKNSQQVNPAFTA